MSRHTSSLKWLYLQSLCFKKSTGVSIIIEWHTKGTIIHLCAWDDWHPMIGLNSFEQKTKALINYSTLSFMWYCPLFPQCVFVCPCLLVARWSIHLPCASVWTDGCLCFCHVDSKVLRSFQTFQCCNRLVNWSPALCHCLGTLIYIWRLQTEMLLNHACRQRVIVMHLCVCLCMCVTTWFQRLRDFAIDKLSMDGTDL